MDRRAGRRAGKGDLHVRLTDERLRQKDGRPRNRLKDLLRQRGGQGRKYGNRKIELDGMTFDSQHEANRWVELKYMERAGLIGELKRQVTFELLPAQRDEDGRMIERPVRYVADFTYKGKDRKLIVEDAKGMKTREYILKRKLMLYFHGIRVMEV